MRPPPGCRFAPRCPFAESRCTATDPDPVDIGGGHIVACHRWTEAAALRVRSGHPDTWMAPA